MQCPTCPEETVVAFCRECGKGVCPTCRKERDGVVYCEECSATVIDATAEETSSESVGDPDTAEAPRPSAARPALPRPRPVPPPPDSAPHPVLAGVLGIVPGLGAVYNGQYVKGLIHVVMFGLLLTIGSGTRDLAPLLIPLTILLVLYMPIEAIRTAQAIRRGEQVEEMSGLPGALFRPADKSAVPGVVLIAVGVFLLLMSLGVIDLEDLLPGWPLLIIGYGVYRLYRSLRPLSSPSQAVETPTEPSVEEL